MTIHPCALHSQALRAQGNDNSTTWKLPGPGEHGRPELCQKAPRPGCWLEPLQPREDSTADYKEIFSLFRNTDWASKDPLLGHMDTWPYSLKTIVQLVFTSDAPQCILWGKDLICIYNAAFWRHIGTSVHPELMGMPANEAFAHMVGSQSDPYPALAEALRTRRTVHVPEAVYLRAEEDGKTFQEIYTSCNISTIYGDNSSPIGLLCAHTETTMKVMTLRKTKMTRALVSATQQLSTLAALKDKIQAVFDDCGLDFPICMIILRPDCFSEHAKQASSQDDVVNYETWVQAGLSDYGARMRTVDYAEPISSEPPAPGELFSHLARRCHAAHGTISFEADNFDTRCTRRVFGNPCRSGQVSPIYPTDAQPGTKPLGFVVLCLTPVRPKTRYFLDYVNTVEALITTVFQNLQEIARSQARLDEVNAARKTMEKYFTVLNDSPVGISVMNWNTKEMLFTNRRLRAILGSPEGCPIEEWQDSILLDDLPAFQTMLNHIKVGDEPLERLLRLKRAHTNGKPAYITVNCCFHQDIQPNGEIGTFLMTAAHDSSDQFYARDAELVVARENERLTAARKFEAERADEADRAKARQLDYIDTLAHEIRNPISAIVQTVDVLLEKTSMIASEHPDQARSIQEITEDLGTIDVCTGHMSRVINDALNISKLEHGSLEIVPQECDLLAHVNSVLRMLNQDMCNKNIRCEGIEIEPDAVKAFSCAVIDPLRYKQIVLNLMTNAVKFTALQPGDKQIRLILSAKQSSSTSNRYILSCMVRDTGSGMSAEAITRIFGKFYQGSSRTHVNYGGSGLGLYISQRLAALLGGKIYATSELGKGSCFAFEMPAEIAVSAHQCSCKNGSIASEDTSARELQMTMDNLAHAIPAPETGRHRRNRSISEKSSKSSSSTSPSRSRKLSTPSTIPGSPLVQHHEASAEQADTTEAKVSAIEPKEPNTVLVIEDNLINQKLMVKQLQMAGYQVLVGNHGLEALQHFKDGKMIDLVVTDIEMPVMNGIETIAAVRALDKSIHQPPFIACSAYAREEQRQEFLDAGMIDVIAKPFKFADLKLRVEHVLKYRLPFRRENTV